MATSRGRCSLHQTTRSKPAEQQAFYNSTEWKKLRARVRREEPTCAICRANPSTSVDHIDGDHTNNTRSNLRALCDSCEATRTGAQHSAKRGAPSHARGGGSQLSETRSAPAAQEDFREAKSSSGFVSSGL